MFRLAALDVQKTRPLEFVFEYEDAQTGQRKCNLYTFEEFIKMVVYCFAKGIPFTYHEIIYPDRPMKLMFDCEVTTDQVIDRDLYTSHIHERVCAAIKSCIGAPLVFQRKKKGKFSVHLVWDYMCDTPKDAFCVAHQVKTEASVEQQGVNIDLWYPLNTSTKTMSMPYSCKSTGPEQMLPTHCSDPFNLPIFLRGLLTFHRGHSPMLEKLPDSLYKWDGPMPATNTHRKSIHTAENEHSILQYLQLYVPCFTPTYVTHYIDGSFSCRQMVFCPFVDRWHKSNAAYINADTKGAVSVRCCKCNKRHMLPFSVCQVAVSETRVPIIWDVTRNTKRMKLM